MDSEGPGPVRAGTEWPTVSFSSVAPCLRHKVKAASCLRRASQIKYMALLCATESVSAHAEKKKKDPIGQSKSVL